MMPDGGFLPAVTGLGLSQFWKGKGEGENEISSHPFILELHFSYAARPSRVGAEQGGGESLPAGKCGARRCQSRGRHLRNTLLEVSVWLSSGSWMLL